MNRNIVFAESNPYSSQLVWPLSDQDRLIQFQLNLLMRNRPKGLLPCYLRLRDDRPQLCLDTTGLQSLDLAFEAANLTPTYGVAVLRKLLDIICQAADSLLSADQFLLDPACVFVKKLPKDEFMLLMAFWPAIRCDEQRADLRPLLTAIGQAFAFSGDEIATLCDCYTQGGLSGLRKHLYNGPPSESPACERHKTLYKVRQTIARHGSALLIVGHFLVVLLMMVGLMTSSYWAFDYRLLTLPLLLGLLVIDLLRLIKNPSVLTRANERLKGYSQRFFLWLNAKGQAQNETAENQTVLLAADPAEFKMAILAQGKPGTPEENEGLRAFILIDEFIIGRDQKSSDLCLASQGIGRQHARITRRAGSFFIIDLGSRNGTRLDGRKLLKNEESLLPDQCLLEFADLSFYFQVD